MVKNPPSNAGDEGSVPGRGTKIPHAGQLSPCATTTEPIRSGARVPQLERSPCAATKTQHSQKKKNLFFQRQDQANVALSH